MPLHCIRYCSFGGLKYSSSSKGFWIATPIIRSLIKAWAFLVSTQGPLEPVPSALLTIVCNMLPRMWTSAELACILACLRVKSWEIIFYATVTTSPVLPPVKPLLVEGNVCPI